MKPKRCIRITGTRNGTLRARVEINGARATWFGKREADGSIRYADEGNHRFEVTIGGEKWQHLDRELQEAIILRAQRYTNHLVVQCNEHALALIMSHPNSDQQ